MTTQPRFIQIHTLHTYPAALINRDDAGLAKRLPLGGAMRTRISSQCLKRHWRKADDHYALTGLNVPMAIRSRLFFEKISQLLVSESVPEQVADIIAQGLRDAMTKDFAKLIKETKKPKARKVKSDNENPESEEDAQNEKKQAFLLGLPEYTYLKQVCLEVAKAEDISPDNARLRILDRLNTERNNLREMPLNCGLESALFGRMVTSDLLASRDAAVYVAHAFTVHEAQVENDYFTVVDDLLQETGELGSAGIFDTELASGLYYGYVVVDVRQLVENLEGDIAAKECFATTTPPERRELAGQVVEHLIHLIATVSPGAKRGSTAPFDWAKFMLVEAGDWQPCSLAGAFHDALPLSAPDRQPLRERAVGYLSREIAKMDAAYGATLARRVMALDAVEVPKAERLTLNDLAQWAARSIIQGAC